MKLLIAQDPTPNEPAPLADLQRAGFPGQCTVLVLTVADVLAPPAPEEAGASSPVAPRVQAAIDTAHRAAADAQTQIQTAFPTWTIAIEAVADAPAWGIIRKAEAWRPDVIIVGAHRQSALGRLVLGSVSQKVLHEARCTVRIVKRGTINTYNPPRVLIGLDGSSDSDAALAAVAARQWPANTAVHVVAVVDPAIDAGSTTASRAAAAQVRVESAAQRLADPNLTTSIGVLEGDPKDALVAEVASWKPDCVFVGARGLSAVERIFLGSVSATLAAHADCSVEVVRPQRET